MSASRGGKGELALTRVRLPVSKKLVWLDLEWELSIERLAERSTSAEPPLKPMRRPVKKKPKPTNRR